MEIQAETMSAQVQRNKYHIARNVKGVTDKYAAPGFWLADKKKAAGRLLTEEEIRAYNRQICDTEGCKVTDITKLPETVTKRQVSELIASYEMPDHRFLDGVPITDGQREALMEKRNLKAKPESAAGRRECQGAVWDYCQGNGGPYISHAGCADGGGRRPGF